MTRNLMAYTCLSVASIVGVYGLTVRQDRNLRHDLNHVVQVNCVASIKTLERYNKALDTQIEIQSNAYKINVQRGDAQRATLNKKAINEFVEAKLPIPTKEQCSKREF